MNYLQFNPRDGKSDVDDQDTMDDVFSTTLGRRKQGDIHQKV